MKAVTQTIKSMAKEHIDGHLEIGTEAGSRMTCVMGMEKCTGKMALFTKENGNKAVKQAMAKSRNYKTLHCIKIIMVPQVVNLLVRVKW
jgi:hypothetical protein